MTTMTATERALLRSQGGPGAGVALTAALPVSTSGRKVIGQCVVPAPISSPLASVHVPGAPSCSMFEDWRAWEPWIFPWKALVPVCGEVGRLTNVMVRDLGIAALHPRVGRRLEIVVDGLLQSGGAHHTGVSGTPTSFQHGWCSSSPSEAAQRREPIPTWSDPGRGCHFIGLIARVRARNATEVMRRRLEQAWRFRWWTMLSCAGVGDSPLSLLGMRYSQGSDGVSPLSDEVVHDHSFAGLG